MSETTIIAIGELVSFAFLMFVGYAFQTGNAAAMFGERGKSIVVAAVWLCGIISAVVTIWATALDGSDRALVGAFGVAQMAAIAVAIIALAVSVMKAAIQRSEAKP